MIRRNATIAHKELSYDIIGLCMEVHNNLGGGFLEVVYKDALEYEFQKLGMFYEREKEFKIHYKDIILPHQFFADFVVCEEVILEVKAVKEFSDMHVAQAINYCKVSKLDLALLVNFGEEKLTQKRVVV